MQKLEELKTIVKRGNYKFADLIKIFFNILVTIMNLRIT